MAKPATGQQDKTTAGNPAAGSAHVPFADALAMNPLVAQSAAAMAAATAIGMSMAGHFAGAFFGALQGAMEAQNRLNTPTPPKADLPQAAQRPADPAETTGPVQKPASARAATRRAKTPAKAGGVKAAPRRTARAGTKAAAKDDLKRISGIGPKLEKLLNEQGIIRVGQIAAWSEAEVARFDKALGLDGRIGRDDWIGQARKLAD